MRIVMTYPFSLTHPGGGTIGCIEICRRLADRGVEMVLIPVGGKENRSGIAGSSDIRPVRPSRLHRLLDAHPVAKKVAEATNEKPTDAVIGWLHEAALLPKVAASSGSLFGMIAGMPYRTWFGRVNRLSTARRLADSLWLKRPLRQAGVIFSLSDFVRRELIELVGVNADDVVTVYWGVDPEFGSISRPERGSLRNLFFFGSFDPIKGIFDALSALRELDAMGYKEWTFYIAGWGQTRDVLQTIHHYGLEERVRLLGRLKHEDLMNHLAQADLAILPSRTESFGLAIAEAQAAGLPVVSYDVGSVPEVVQAGSTALLVEAGNTSALARAVASMIDDPRRASLMGSAGRERVLTRFSWDTAAAEIIEIIRSRYPFRQDSSCLE